MKPSTKKKATNAGQTAAKTTRAAAAHPCIQEILGLKDRCAAVSDKLELHSPEFKILDAQAVQLATAARDLASKNFQEQVKEVEALDKKLQAAKKAADAALKETQKVAEFIRQVAQVVEAVAKLARALA